MTSYTEAVELGVRARNAGQIHEGLASLMLATTLAPSEWQAYFEIGFHYETAGELGLAQAWYRASCKRNNSVPVLLKRLVLVTGALGQTDEAKGLLLNADLSQWSPLAEVGALSDYADFRRRFPMDEVASLIAQLERRFDGTPVDDERLAILAGRALQSDSGFAYLRLGDGEGALISRVAELETSFGALTNYSREVFLDQFLANRRQLVEGFLMACRRILDRVAEVDVLAFPQASRLVHAFETADMVGAPAMLGLWLELLRAPALPTQRTSTEMHWDFLRHGGLDSAVHQARRILVITSRASAVHFIQSRFAEISVSSILIPAEPKTTNPNEPQVGDSGVEGLFPNRYLEVLDDLARRDLGGSLVLVGAGPLGKHFVLGAKAVGGVALDIGSVLDIWAGLDRPNVSGELPPT
jgi:hypothetical protein